MNKEKTTVENRFLDNLFEKGMNIVIQPIMAGIVSFLTVVYAIFCTWPIYARLVLVFVPFISSVLLYLFLKKKVQKQKSTIITSECTEQYHLIRDIRWIYTSIICLILGCVYMGYVQFMRSVDTFAISDIHYTTSVIDYYVRKPKNNNPQTECPQMSFSDYIVMTYWDKNTKKYFAHDAVVYFDVQNLGLSRNVQITNAWVGICVHKSLPDNLDEIRKQYLGDWDEELCNKMINYLTHREIYFVGINNSNSVGDRIAPDRYMKDEYNTADYRQHYVEIPESLGMPFGFSITPPTNEGFYLVQPFVTIRDEYKSKDVPVGNPVLLIVGLQ